MNDEKEQSFPFTGQIDVYSVAVNVLYGDVKFSGVDTT